MGEGQTRLFELTTENKVSIPPAIEIEWSDIPDSVTEQVLFENNSQELSESEAYKKPLAMDFGEAGKSYVMAYWARRKLGGIVDFYVTHLIDTTTSGDVTGGIISFIELDEDGEPTEEGPYVQFNFTKSDYEKRGLALRRLISLNKATKQLFNLPLSSGSFFAPGVENIWQKLEAAHLVEQFEPHYYRFI